MQAADQVQLALHYYQVYDRAELMCIVVLGYVGWIFFGLKHMLGLDLVGSPGGWKHALFVLIAMIHESIAWIEGVPLQYHVYTGFPILFWTSLLHSSPAASSTPVSLTLTHVFAVSLGAFGIALGYTYRQAYFGLLLGVAGYVYFKSPRMSIASVLVGSFTLISVDINKDMYMMSVGGCCLVAMCAWLCQKHTSMHLLTYIQLAALFSSVLVSRVTDYMLAEKMTIPWILRTTSWVLFLASPLLPQVFPIHNPTKTNVNSPKYAHKWIHTSMGFASQFVLLSVNYEACFLACFMLLLHEWLGYEQHSVQYGNKSINAMDLRVAFFFVLFCHVAFFGTGNFASMSSFQISSTYRFVTVFSPFLMGGLLVYKILVPYFVVTGMMYGLAQERTRNKVSVASFYQLLVLVLMICDLIALPMFFFVKDHGSWLEIGNSISQYGFIGMHFVFLPVLLLISRVIY